MEIQSSVATILPSGKMPGNEIKVENGFNGLDTKPFIESEAQIIEVIKKPKKSKRKNFKKDGFTKGMHKKKDLNIADIIDNTDSMLVWSILKPKILQKFGAFDLIVERIK